MWQTRVGTVSEAKSVQETHVPPPECTPVHRCVYMGVTHLCWGWPHVSPASCRAGVWMGRHASGCRAHPCTSTRTTRTLTGCPAAPACHLASPGTGGSAPRRPLPRERGRSQGQRGSTTQSPPSRMRPQPASVQGRGCRDPTAGPQGSPLPSCPETDAQARVGLRGPGELPQWASPWLWGGRGFSPHRSALSDLGELRVQGKRELPPTRVQGAQATPCPCPRVLREWRTSPVLVGCGSRPDP